MVSCGGFGVVGSYQCDGFEGTVNSRAGEYDSPGTSNTVDAGKHHGSGSAHALDEYDGSCAADAMGEHDGSGTSNSLEVAATR